MLRSTAARPTLKASRISSSESVSCILRAMRVMNSAKSIELLPSASTCSCERDHQWSVTSEGVVTEGIERGMQVDVNENVVDVRE